MKYRLSILLEKTVSDNQYQIIKEHTVSYDDFTHTERMFVLLVETEGKILERTKTNEQEKSKQGSLFKKK